MTDLERLRAEAHRYANKFFHHFGTARAAWLDGALSQQKEIARLRSRIAKIESERRAKAIRNMIEAVKEEVNYRDGNYCSDKLKDALAELDRIEAEK